MAEKDILYKYFVELSAHKISYLAVFTFLYTIVQCLILFYANFFISIFIGKIKFISNIGSSSLYLCGNETMVKNLLVFVLGLFGVNFIARGPILALIYSLVIIAIIHFIFTPIEKAIIKFITKKL